MKMALNEEGIPYRLSQQIVKTLYILSGSTAALCAFLPTSELTIPMAAVGLGTAVTAEIVAGPQDITLARLLAKGIQGIIQTAKESPVDISESLVQ